MNIRFSHIMRLISVFFFVAALIVFAGRTEYAQEPPAPPEAVPGGPPLPPEQAPQVMTQQPQQAVTAPVTLPRRSAGTAARNDVSFNFDDADVYEVIQTVFGDILRVNYMVDARVKGRVNFRTVTPVSRDDVMPLVGMMLKLNGAGFVQEKGLYKILPLSDIPGTMPQVFVYPLQNAKAKHIGSLLQSIFSGSGSSAAPGRFIPEAPPNPQATPQSKPGGATGGGGGFTAGSGGLVAPETKVFPDDTTNSLVVLATADDYKFIEETIKKLDTAPRQVMIEVLIAEVTLSKEFQFGLEWVISNNTSIHPFKKTVNLDGPIGQNSNLLSTAASAASGFSGFSYAAKDIAGNIKALLQSLATDNKVTVLASPHILAADNLEARIQIGNQVPIATSQMTAVGASNSILSTIQYKDIGTILKVKPQINESGVVSMEVSQEVSDYSTQSVLGTTQYVFTKREATTNLVSQDGQTIVIGGLIQDNKSKSRTGIPVLSSIPVLGYLFGSNDDTTTKTEIIVLLTPHVIKNQQDAGSVTSDYINRLQKGAKDIDLDTYIKDNEQKKHP
ncbi:MAG: hypothetical protein HQL08_09855 [Nitrospirae bacterium]|nr:hypothetical protein [Nitrospirota bacterium]